MIAYVTVADAARITGLSKRMLRSYAKEGRIPGIQLSSGQWLLEKAAVLQWHSDPVGRPRGS